MKLCACGQPATGYKYCASCAETVRRRNNLTSANRFSAENPERVALTKQTWAANNPEKTRDSRAIWRLSNPESDVRAKRDHSLNKKYGMSLLEWEALFESQGLKCAICGSSDTNGPNWHTDHDHDTGQVRGILCHSCNTGIGHLQDDPIVCEQAAEYLRKHDSLHALRDKLRSARFTPTNIDVLRGNV